MLAEEEPSIKVQITAVGLLNFIGEENVLLNQPILGASIENALKAADDWLEQTERLARENQLASVK